MSPRLRLILSVLALVAVLMIGTAGYMLLETERDLSLLEAAYMTVITVSTVGFTEVWELSPATRIWTIGVIAVGVGTVSVAFTSLITLFVGGDFRSMRERRRMSATIENLRDHVILCGYGRMGSLALREIARDRVPVVVVEIDTAAEGSLREAQVPYIVGDATDEDTLKKAGVMRARALVAVLRSDADNVFITLTARTLRSDLPIIVRAEQPGTEAKLKRAGATRVICPQVMGATRIADVLTRPNVVDLVEMANKGVDLEIDEYEVGAQSPLVGKSLRESALRERTSASVVAVKRANGETLFNPGPDAVLGLGDTMVLVGPAGVSSRLDAL